MRIKVLLFGVLKDVFAGDQRLLELPDVSTVETLLDRFRQLAPEQGNLWSSVAVAVNQNYAPANHPLHEGDEVALLPPVSGGNDPREREEAGDSGQPAGRIALVRAPIDAAPLIAQLKKGEDGAVVVFDGIVRNNTRGRRTLYLDYQAYEEMALRMMNSLAQDAIAQHGARDVSMVHRLGRLQIGETSILIAVSSAHRSQAFEACRWLIDTLKKTVPIWKKEHFQDGAVWADGESFPAEALPKGTANS